jgi:hypothetical protein
VLIHYENKSNSVNKKKHMDWKIKGEVTDRVSDSIHPQSSLLSLCWPLTGQPQDIFDLMLIQLTRVALSLSYVANLHK